MSKQVTKIEDLSPDQLRAQVRLCFKFMEQCLSVLNGEDVSEEAVIRLVDPIGDSSDMELFYKCKQVGGAGDLADAMETIDQLSKKVNKLHKRLAKKHDELEKAKNESGCVKYTVNFDLDEFSKKIDEACKVFAKATKLFESRQIKDAFVTPKAFKDFKKIVEGLYAELPKSFANAVAEKCISVSKTEIHPTEEHKSYIDALLKQAEEMAEKWRDTLNYAFEPNCLIATGLPDFDVRTPVFGRIQRPLKPLHFCDFSKIVLNTGNPDVQAFYRQYMGNWDFEPDKKIVFSRESEDGGQNARNKFHIRNLTDDECSELVAFCKELQKERDFKAKWQNCKYKKDQKVYFLENNTAKSSKISDVDCSKPGQIVYDLCDESKRKEKFLFPSVEELLSDLKKNLSNG